MKNDKTFTMRMPGTVWKRLKELAKKDGRSLSDFIRRALERIYG